MARSKHPARYAVTSGLAGLYMPDLHHGAFSVDRRKDLADEIRSAIETADFPKSTIGQAKLTRLWKFIQRNGSSVAHFTINHKDREIAFHGLTEAEYIEQVEADERGSASLGLLALAGSIALAVLMLVALGEGTRYGLLASYAVAAGVALVLKRKGVF